MHTDMPLDDSDGHFEINERILLPYFEEAFFFLLEYLRLLLHSLRAF